MKLAENIMHFARVLREAGLPVGPDRVIDALRALEVTGIEHREDFYWTLAAVFLERREHFELFDQAFHIFWRDPHMLERVMALMLPKIYGRGETKARRPAGEPGGRSDARRSAPSDQRRQSRSRWKGRARRDLHGLRSRAAAARRLRNHDDARSWRRRKS